MAQSAYPATAKVNVNAVRTSMAFDANNVKKATTTSLPVRVATAIQLA